MGLSCKFEKLHRCFENEMACYSSNFGFRFQMMAGISKKYGFTLSFDIPRLFTPRKKELPRKMANGKSDCRRPLISQCRGRATNSLQGRDWRLVALSGSRNVNSTNFSHPVRNSISN